MKAKIGGVKEEAAILISNSAESMKKFYDEKLLMAREKHESKMRILALKEQILKKKLEEWSANSVSDVIKFFMSKILKF